VTARIELDGGIEFGRCRCCGGRTSAERAKDPASAGLCFVCETWGCRRRPIRPGVRFRLVDGATAVVVDEAAARRMTRTEERFR
jgi:hypothetical protein